MTTPNERIDTNPVPPNMPTALREVAGYLDASDAFITEFAIGEGHPYRAGDDVQRDLRRLADWFSDHPGCAEDAFGFVYGVEAQS